MVEVKTRIVCENPLGPTTCEETLEYWAELYLNVEINFNDQSIADIKASKPTDSDLASAGWSQGTEPWGYSKRFLCKKCSDRIAEEAARLLAKKTLAAEKRAAKRKAKQSNAI